jgi:hypothetical protein
MNTHTPMYRDMSQVRAANAEAGFYFFEPDTMRFFRSRVGEEIIGGRFFVSSEKRDYDAPREYTVRVAMRDGSIGEVGEVGQYSSHGSAQRAAKRAAASPIEVRHDPYEMDREREQNPRHFQWRAWTTGDDAQPIGTRTTLWAARRVAADLNRARKLAAK